MQYRVAVCARIRAERRKASLEGLTRAKELDQALLHAGSAAPARAHRRVSRYIKALKTLAAKCSTAFVLSTA